MQKIVGLKWFEKNIRAFKSPIFEFPATIFGYQLQLILIFGTPVGIFLAIVANSRWHSLLQLATLFRCQLELRMPTRATLAYFQLQWSTLDGIPYYSWQPFLDASQNYECQLELSLYTPSSSGQLQMAFLTIVGNPFWMPTRVKNAIQSQECQLEFVNVSDHFRTLCGGSH